MVQGHKGFWWCWHSANIRSGVFFFFFYSHLLHIYTTWLSRPTQFSFKRACSPSLWLHWSLAYMVTTTTNHGGVGLTSSFSYWHYRDSLLPVSSQRYRGQRAGSTAGLTDLSPLNPPGDQPAQWVLLKYCFYDVTPTKGLRCLLECSHLDNMQNCRATRLCQDREAWGGGPEGDKRQDGLLATDNTVSWSESAQLGKSYQLYTWISVPSYTHAMHRCSIMLTLWDPRL